MEDSTTPAKSMPGTMGNLRTTGDLPVTASPSLKLTLEYSTRTVTGAFGSCAFVMLTVILSIGPLARLDRRFLPLLYNRRHFGVLTFVIAFVLPCLMPGFRSLAAWAVLCAIAIRFALRRWEAGIDPATDHGPGSAFAAFFFYVAYLGLAAGTLARAAVLSVEALRKSRAKRQGLEPRPSASGSPR